MITDHRCRPAAPACAEPTPPRWEVADIVRLYGDSYRQLYPVSPGQQQVLEAIAACRTAQLGGHVEQCPQCGFERYAYHSCRNRHCPKCQTNARNQWVAARCQELLNVRYSHVVFTIPHELAALALQNKKTIYNLLFQTSAATLIEIAADPKHLGAEIGFLSVLHTWGQNLQAHPHVHCVIPAGGLSPDHTRWVHPQQHFLLPVKVLSRVFRGKFVAGLKHLYRRHRLEFFGNLQHLADPKFFSRFLRVLFRQDWVVYAKPPFGGPEHVLHYLARYTHRVAISNHRLISFTGDQVTFRWKDYAHGNKKRKMTLSADEFLRRFLLHVLPRGFVRIRHFGFLSVRRRRDLLPLCRGLLQQTPAPYSTVPTSAPSALVQTCSCPCCGGPMVILEKLTAQQIHLRRLEWGALIDSS
jgi:Putative transposase/Transposase zinc-binding domain